jgi:hypothetical protein
MPEYKKEPYKQLVNYDKQRSAFEKSVFSRFELVLRLLGAGSNEKIIKIYKGFNVFKEELAASLNERGFAKMPSLELLARKRYSKIDKDSKQKYKNQARAKTEEMIDQVFIKVLKKSNIDFGSLFGLTEDRYFNLFDEDYDEFIHAEENGYNI